MAAYKDEKRGTWYVSFHYHDWTGKNRRKMKRGFKTRREALEWEKHFQMQEGANLDMTFEDFWKSYTLDMKPKLKENTWNTKETIVLSKILPYFKEKKMRDIRAKDIITWQNEISTLKGVGGKPLKATYMKVIQSELSALFNHAVKFYELKENPVLKAGPLGKATAEEMNFWTKEEYLKFVEMVKDKPVSYYAFQILYWCGIREGELLALCRQDVDVEHKVLHITKSYQRIKCRDIITDPKTPKSKRDVVIPDFLCRQLQEYLEMECVQQGGDRIFPISKAYLHHEMERGAKAAGVKRIRIHDLRHSHVSMLINMGFTAVAIGNRVGHESTGITYRYAHMFPSEQKQMAFMLNNAFIVEKETETDDVMA